MTDTFIHNIRVSYDEEHERVRNFVTYLKKEESKDEMKAYYEEARRNKDNKIHLNDKLGNEFTLTYISNYNCELRLRGM